MGTRKIPETDELDGGTGLDTAVVDQFFSRVFFRRDDQFFIVSVYSMLLERARRVL